MKKYTPVFGPQELFDTAHDNHLFAIQTKNGIHFFIAASTAIEAVVNMNKDEFIRFAQRRIEEIHDSIDLSDDIDELIKPEFIEWWENHGQFIRTGGGDYERTFAFGAFRYLMPRILGQKQQEPKRWTVDDQKAGRLPEAGVSVLFNKDESLDYFYPVDEWLDGDELNVLAHVKAENGCACVAVYNSRDKYTTQLVIKSIKPIETPDEKAKRVKLEWCNKANHQKLFSSESEYAAVKKCISNIYDELLSGELPPVPAKDGE